MKKDLERFAKEIRKKLDKKDHKREVSLPLCRRVVRLSSESIRAIHRSEKEKSGRIIKEAEDVLRKAQKALKSFPDLYNAGYLQSAEKEYVEAVITFSLINKERLPSPEKLKVGYAEYLTGMAEAIGELRRHLLDQLRKGKEEEGEKVLEIMDDLYYFLIDFDYPGAILHSLRHYLDTCRSLLEKSRADITSAICQKRLRESLK